MGKGLRDTGFNGIQKKFECIPRKSRNTQPTDANIGAHESRFLYVPLRPVLARSARSRCRELLSIVTICDLLRTLCDLLWFIAVSLFTFVTFCGLWHQKSFPVLSRCSLPVTLLTEEQ